MSQQDHFANHEPSTLQTSPVFEVAMRLPSGGWYVLDDQQPWPTWYLVKTGLKLGRPVRIRDRAGHVTSFSPDGDRLAQALLLLDLFSIPVSDLCGGSTGIGRE